MVTPAVCRTCPFVDHHFPGDGSAPGGEIRPDVAVERLIELINGPARAWPPGWEDWDVTHRAHRLAADRFLAGARDYPDGRFRGRGIVIAGGGPAYFPSLYVTVRAIRYVGCSLPIQVWYLGRDNELPPDRRAILERYGVECVDADAVREQHPCRILNGWELKVYAVLHSRFEEALSLDADCYPVRDPAFLFDEAGYRQTGAVFWPDFRNGPPLDWRPFGVAPTGRVSFESGQFLLNKRLAWEPLQLAWWYNDHSDWSYLHGYGDKHTLEVAWAKCGARYAMYREDVKWGADSFHHVGPEGRLLFLHRCRDKFRFGDPTYMNPQPFASNRFHPELPLEAECFGWLRELRHELEPEPSFGGRSMSRIKAFMYTCPERRTVWEETMGRWRLTDWGEDPVVVVDDGSGPPSQVRHVATARRMFALAGEQDVDYCLFLEDDLLFNLHIAHNLAHWTPVLDGSLWMGTLYKPGLFPVLNAPGDSWDAHAHRLALGGYYGSQAIVLSRAAVAMALREWDEPGLLDLKLAGIAARHRAEVVLHTPSLVQQIPVASVCGCAEHRANNFDPFFRA
jgi:hypothetical protein